MQELIHVDQKKADVVLKEIDKLINLTDEIIHKADDCFIDLSFLLVEAKRGAYWTLRGCNDEHEYVAKVFPQSRAQYYAFIRMGTHLSKFDRKQLKAWGRSKCEDLARLQIHFNAEVPQEWIEYLNEDSKDTFRRRVKDYFDSLDEGTKKKKITGETKQEPETEDTFITLRIFGDSIYTFNLAMDTMAKITGSDKSVSDRVVLALANFNSQFADDGTGHVSGKNSYILSTIKGLVQQLDFKSPDVAEMLIGIVAQGVESNAGTA